jgi:glutathione S-transferase
MLHTAQHHGGLLPADTAARARVITWMFAALTTVEPPIFDLDMLSHTNRDRPRYRDRLAILQDRVRNRLGVLTQTLGVSDWLEGDFNAGDLMMVAALRRLKGSGIEDEFLVLAAYVARGEDRPAFVRAFEAQRTAFIASGGANAPL